MKKGLKSVILIGAILSAVTCGLALAACTNGNNGDTGNHEHIVERWSVVTEATCTKGGTEKGACTVCGEEQTRPIEALGHDWDTDNGYVLIEATCTQEGEQRVSCKRCDATENQPVAKTEHNWQTTKLYANATCEEPGLRDVKCRTCGIVEENQEIPALGHSWQALGVLREPTCTEPGENEAICSRCNTGGTVSVPALGHDWETEYTVDAKPSFEKAGSRSIHCKRCDEKRDVREIAQLNANTRIGYEFRVTRSNGDLITVAGIRYAVVDENGDTQAEGAFNGGVATVPLFPQTYTVTVSGYPEGYVAQAGYTAVPDNTGASGNTVCNIALSASLIEQPLPSTDNTKYVTGSVMHDFTYTTIKTNARPESETITLSELLKTKKMVMLNFWYTGCVFCRYEFPGMEAAYQKYKDDIAIIAIDDNNYSGDTEADVRAFANNPNYNLSFYVVMDTEGLAARFGVNVYPTTVIIDSEGVVSEIHNEALINPNYQNDSDAVNLAICTAKFAAIFEKYTNPPYWQYAAALEAVLPEERKD